MLNNMWDIENQLVIVLPKIIDQSNTQSLKDALTTHLEETRTQKSRLEALLTHHNHALTYERDMAFETLLQDIASDLSLLDDPTVKDAFIVASLQTIEHIEISKYTTLLSWAKELEDEYGGTPLKQSLDEETAANKKLAELANGGLFGMGLNEKAAITDDTL